MTISESGREALAKFDAIVAKEKELAALPASDPRSKESVMERLRAALTGKKQRKMTRIDVSETSGVDFPAHGVLGWAVIKGEGMTELDILEREAAKLVAAGTVLNKAAGIAWLADHRPELALKAQAAHAKQFAKEQAAGKPEESAPAMGESQEKLMATAKEYFISGRVATVAAGVVMAMEHYPEVADQALTESIESNVL